MPNWRTRSWLLLAAIVAAAVPVAFGGIRAVTTGDDVRYLWMAAAAILGSMAVAARRGSDAIPTNVTFGRGVSAVACGTLCAAVTGVLQGARSVPGVAIVALAFGVCTGTSAVFAMHARQARDRGTT